MHILVTLMKMKMFETFFYIFILYQNFMSSTKMMKFTYRNKVCYMYIPYNLILLSFEGLIFVEIKYSRVPNTGELQKLGNLE